VTAAANRKLAVKRRRASVRARAGLALIACALGALWPGQAPGADPAYLTALVEAARRERLDRDPQWLRLGHYRPGLRSGHKSQVDGPAFFLSPNGRRDPARELEATLAGFFAPDPSDPSDAEAEHPQCRFPARYAWLNSRLGFDPARLPEKPCPRFQAFRDQVQARSVTLVFSSYYLNNPASAFGHTFLRLNKTESAEGGEHFQLLDYGVEFAARLDTKSALVYAYKGLTGGFSGYFSNYPYFYKVRQYNDFETRDIWEYDLDLTPRQVEMLVAHLWELGSTYFDYYYLNENCSYHLLTVLEAANPELHLADQLPWWVIPADTVKALYANPGLVRQVHYRPSIWTQFQHRAAGLTAEQKRVVKALVEEPDAPLRGDLAPAEAAAVLDAALDYLDFRHAKQLLKREGGPVSIRQRLLEWRSEIAVVSPRLAIEPPYDRMPQRGHGSMRVGLSAGYSDRLGHFQRADLRFALHDLTDPQDGYPDFAQIEFLSTRLRYNADPDSLWLEHVDVVRVVSLSPVDDFLRQLSWKVGVGARTVRDESCRDCLAASFDLGGGYAISLLDRPRTTAFLLGDVEALASPRFEDEKLRLGVGPLGGLQARIGERVSLLATGTWKHLVDHDPERTYAASLIAKVHLTPRLSLSVEGARVPTAWEGSAGFLLYF
jgi:hypothetical protein